MIVVGKNSKKKSIFVTFLVSYMVVLFIPVAIGSISYIRSAKAIKDEMESYNLAMLEQAQQVVDEQVRSIDKIALDVALDSKVQNFMYKKKPLGWNDVYTMFEVIQNIAKYQNVNASIDSLYVYFANTNIILNNTGKYEPLFFYNEVTPYADMQFEQWYDILRNYSYKRFLPVKPISVPQDGENVITYFQSIPFDAKVRPLATIAVVINQKKIDNMLKSINVLNKGLVYILDGNNVPIMSIGNSQLSYNIPKEKLTAGGDGYFYDSINGQEVIVSYISSKYNTWKYVSVIPTHVFMNKLRTIKVMTTWVMVVELCIGIFLAYLMASKSYRPIKRLAEGLRQRLTNPSQDSKNEMALIEEITAATVRENEHIKETLNQQYPLLKTSFLQQLIRGNVAEVYNLKQSLQTYNIKFPYKYFCVLLIDIDDCSKFVKNDSLEEQALVKSVIANVMEELGNKDHVAYMTDMGWEQMVLLVNINDDLFDFKNEVHEIAQRAQSFLNKEFSIIISVGIGGKREGVNGIAESYKEAVNALGYKMIKGKGSIIAFDDICHGGQNYIYPLDIERQVLNSIKIGDQSKVETLLHEIFKQNFLERHLSLDVARCLFFDIMSTAIKALNEINLDYANIFGYEFQPITRLMACQTVGEMQSTLDYIFNKICTCINDNKASHNSQLKTEILEYIREHYMDNDISLITIADAMHITPTYLSHFFKEQMGQSVMDYVNHLKIDKAKELLKNTPLSLSDISKKVGYTNSSILIRAFKKHEGVTPGRYRYSISQ